MPCPAHGGEQRRHPAGCLQPQDAVAPLPRPTAKVGPAKCHDPSVCLNRPTVHHARSRLRRAGRPRRKGNCGDRRDVTRGRSPAERSGRDQRRPGAEALPRGRTEPSRTTASPAGCRTTRSPVRRPTSPGRPEGRRDSRRTLRHCSRTGARNAATRSGARRRRPNARDARNQAAVVGRPCGVTRSNGRMPARRGRAPRRCCPVRRAAPSGASTRSRRGSRRRSRRAAGRSRLPPGAPAQRPRGHIPPR